MDRVCIVTGGTSGIGLATATRLAAEGARVAIVGRDGTRGRAAESGLRASPPDAASERAAPPGQAARGSVPEREAVFEQADVASEADVRRVVAAVVDRWGRVDILVNNAAMMPFRPVVDLSVDDWDRVLGVNLRGAFLFARACIPHMHRGGEIVNVSSVHAHETTIDVVPCAASKGALEAFTRALSRELAPRNIRVNCVAPGAVDTPMLWSNPHVRGSRLREPPGALRPGPAGAPSGPRVRGDDPTVAGGAPVGAAVPGALAGPRPGGRDGRSGRWRAAQRSGRDAAATARVGGPPALESRS